MARNNRNNLEKHVFSDRVKWGVTVLCILLIGVFLAAACTQGFTNGNPWGWFDKKEETEKEQVAAGGGIAAPVEDDVQTMSLAVTKISPEEYGDYGIMPIADTAFTIKASYTGDVTFKELDWAIKWKSGASGQWGNGKTVTEYATISPSSDTLTLTLTVKQAFGEQIVITATNRAVSSVTKSATLDYARRVTGVSLAFKGKATHSINTSSRVTFTGSVVSTGTDTDKMTYTPTYTYSTVYTVEDTPAVTELKMKLNPTWFTAFRVWAAQKPAFQGSHSMEIDDINQAAGTEKDVTSSCPDLTSWKALVKLCDTYDTMAQYFAGFSNASSANANLAMFVFKITVKGSYSTYTFDYDTSAGKLGFCYGTASFGTVAAAGSLNFDKAAFVA